MIAKIRLRHYGHQALINLSSSKLRTSLAMSGILIGTATIVSLMTCSKLATEKALIQFKELGTELVSVSVFQTTTATTATDAMPLAIWRTLPLLASGIKYIAPYTLAYQSVSFHGQYLDKPVKTILGVDESLASLLHMTIREGLFVSNLASFERVCVIGSHVAYLLKKYTANPLLGQQLQIGKSLYTIIGIVNPWQENSFFTEDINQAIMIPIAGSILLSKDIKINHAIVWLKNDKHIDTHLKQIQHAILTQNPHLSLFMRSAKQMIKQQESQSKILTLLLTVIGSIALFVGGIGVMNIMLIAVSERQKEIGLRKAIGAKQHEIQALFLVESLLLSISGGLFGILLGLFVTTIIAYCCEWPWFFYQKPLWIGFMVSLCTGISFGYYPAYRAARLEPITALRGD